ncbi:MAG: hypothetical protein ACJAYN_003592 [Bermanella sp.]|jgi:hypothetical protein|nr:hypothetical protein CXF81_06330 [Glaciecola sp. 33A]
MKFVKAAFIFIVLIVASYLLLPTIMTDVEESEGGNKLAFGPAEIRKEIDNSNDFADRKIETSIVELKNTFSVYIESLEPEIADYYKQLNNDLFGALQFSDRTEYETLLINGFPSETEVKFLIDNEVLFTSNMLFAERINSVEANLDGNISSSNLRAANLVRAIRNLEQSVQYYIPHYTLGAPFPVSSDWPSKTKPELIDSKIKELIIARAAINSEYALDKLALARFLELNVYGEEQPKLMRSVFEQVSEAQEQLKSEYISLYVNEMYPENASFYNNIINEKLPK